ncbi:hypothetical protein [Streptomyces stelliscabiei]|uniref:hypothetical protein n=1 Tax=Streptomyces stelliscabiei TaxID=146820 RepID=UPI0029B5C792|nr:hypothetical protein [Streptomyces stelliscabiei]MDX2557714.1 hypothetical protein [Streptomyces stelliscabiei]MDX2617420.1 hypothetical protein [Streptomyces stelliscabiei]MDX2641593.1 hypothetical protein [Streptomyces stelliscabiei]MDX2667532.1 hypothetical protein [Streptomyces stelliscabiei]MDX2715860.1 hypothetical protein [Streptomyces stelliscabiei]
MTESQPPVRIHILTPEDEDDADLTDLGLVNLGGERLLFLKPQSFDSAVRQVRSALPDLPLEQVERMVREHPEFKDFGELLETVKSAPPLDITPTPDEPLQPGRLRGRARRWVVAAALVPALAGSWALGYLTAGSPAGTSASAPDSSPSPSGASAGQSSVKPFIGPEFLDFSNAGQIDCKPIANLEAECTDADGMVMASKAAIGPDSTIFTFSYGSERIGLRIFADKNYAETWVRQDGTTELYPNVSRSGRYVLWGTDKGRLSEYTDLIQDTEVNSSAKANASGLAAPLPPRLAALTLGTLGLDRLDVETILYAPNSAPVDESVLLAAQSVLGVQTTAPWVTGGDDIAAIAAGLDQPPVVSVPVHTPDMEPPVGPVVDGRPDSTPTESTEGTQPTTTSPAPTTATPSTEPSTPTDPTEPSTGDTTPSEPPAETIPTVPESSDPPATDPVEETPTAPVEEVPAPADETPTIPVEETPAPAETPAAPVEETPGPVEDTPAPVETPTEGAVPPGQAATPPADTTDQADDGDLLILDSAWTVAAA